MLTNEIKILSLKYEILCVNKEVNLDPRGNFVISSRRDQYKNIEPIYN